MSDDSSNAARSDSSRQRLATLLARNRFPFPPEIADEIASHLSSHKDGLALSLSFSLFRTAGTDLAWRTLNSLDPIIRFYAPDAQGFEPKVDSFLRRVRACVFHGTQNEDVLRRLRHTTRLPLANVLSLDWVYPDTNQVAEFASAPIQRLRLSPWLLSAPATSWNPLPTLLHLELDAFAEDFRGVMQAAAAARPETITVSIRDGLDLNDLASVLSFGGKADSLNSLDLFFHEEDPTDEFLVAVTVLIHNLEHLRLNSHHSSAVSFDKPFPQSFQGTGLRTLVLQTAIGANCFSMGDLTILAERCPALVTLGLELQVGPEIHTLAVFAFVTTFLYGFSDTDRISAQQLTHWLQSTFPILTTIRPFEDSFAWIDTVQGSEDPTWTAAAGALMSRGNGAAAAGGAENPPAAGAIMHGGGVQDGGQQEGNGQEGHGREGHEQDMY